MSDSISWDGPTGIAAAIQSWVVQSSGLADAKVFYSYEGKPRPPAPYIEMTVQLVRPIGHDWTTSADNPLAFAPLTVTSVDTVTNALAIAAHGLSNGDGPVRLSSTGALPAPLLANTDYWAIFVDDGHLKLAATFEQTGGQMPLGAGNPITPIDLTTAGSGTITVSSTDETVPAGKEIIRTAQGFREVTVHFECFYPEGSGYGAMKTLSTVFAALQLYVYPLDLAGFGVSDFGQSFPQGAVQQLEGKRGGVLEPRAVADLVGYVASSVTGFETIITSFDAEIRLKNEAGVNLPAIPVHIP